MTDITDYIRAASKKIKPDAAWFERTRERLVLYMRVHPITPSLYRRVMARFPRWSPFSQRSFRSVTALATLVICIILGGVSARASSSLPGSMLYSWKIGVNEKVESLFIFGEMSRSQFELSLVDRRLNEISTLVARKQLTQKSVRLAKTSLETQANAVNDQIIRVASQNSAAALQTALEFDATLKAHREVLRLLEPSSDQETKPAINTALQSIEETSTTLAGKISELENDDQQKTYYTELSQEEQGKIIEEKKAVIDERIEAATIKVADLPIDDPIRIRAEVHVKTLGELAAQVADALDDKQYQNALELIQKLSAAVMELEVLLNAAMIIQPASPDTLASSSTVFTPVTGLASPSPSIIIENPASASTGAITH